MTTTDPLPDVPNPAGEARRGRLLPLALAAGVVAGLAAWGAGEASLNAFVPRLTAMQALGNKFNRVSFADQMDADTKNARLAYAELGAALGLVLGLAGGLARRSARSAASAGGIGLVLGAALGLGGALAAIPFYNRAKDVAQEDLSHDLLLPLMVHAGAWSLAGLAGGLALGIGLGIGGRPGRARAGRAAVGGLVGAVLGATIFEVVGGLAFQDDKTDEPISRTWTTRLLARLAVAALVAAFAAIMAESRPAPTPKTPDEAEPVAG